MKRWFRAWGATVLAWGFVLAIGGAAIAGAGSSSHKSTRVHTVEASESSDVEASESEAPESPDAEASHSPGDTHGACVSHWAHESKSQGLTGSDRGHFISTVAQSDATGADCDFSAQLQEALTKQAAASPRAHGKSAEHQNQSSTHGS